MYKALLPILIFADIAMWLFQSLYDNNYAIISIHASILFLIFAVRSRLNFEVEKIFAASLFFRSFFMLFAWHIADDERRRYLTGTNSDSLRFWEASLTTLNDSVLSFVDPIFPIINYFFSKISSLIDTVSYLATTQSVLFMGSLIPCLTYYCISELYNKKVAKAASVITVISPIEILYSTGLMRDIVIQFFGLIFLYFLCKIYSVNGIIKKLIIVLILGAVASILYGLRAISLFTYIGAVLVLLLNKISSIPKKNLSFKKYILITGFASIGTAVFYFANERFDELLNYAFKLRLGDVQVEGMEINHDGITARIAELNPLLFIFISPLAWVQPFPFFNWAPPYYEPGAIAVGDVLMGLGGLFNQFILILFLIGFVYGYKRERKLILYSTVYLIILGAMMYVTFGQVRIIMAHGFFFLYLVAAFGWKSISLRNVDKGSLILMAVLIIFSLNGSYIMYSIFALNLFVFIWLLIFFGYIFYALYLFRVNRLIN